MGKLLELQFSPVRQSLHLFFQLDEEEDELLPTNPIERKDAKIAELEKTAAQVASHQESVLKMKAEKSIAIKAASVFKNKIKFARKVIEERWKECLPIPGFENEHPM